MSTLRSYRLLLAWQSRRLKGFLPLAVVVQALFALGIVVGYPMLFPQMDRLTTLFLATGAPTITLITMGVVAVPQLVAQAKTEGTLDYMRALPVPRLVYLFADLTVWLAVVLPGVAFAIVVGAVRSARPRQRGAGIHRALGPLGPPLPRPVPRPLGRKGAWPLFWHGHQPGPGPVRDHPGRDGAGTARAERRVDAGHRVRGVRHRRSQCRGTADTMCSVVDTRRRSCRPTGPAT